MIIIHSPRAQMVPLVCSAGDISTPIACVFAQGEAHGPLIVKDQPRLHVVELAHWQDGSLKHAIVGGIATLVEGDNALELVPGTPAVGALTVGTLPHDVVMLGDSALYLADATLHRTWIVTSDLHEVIYRHKSGTRYVFWQIRVWSNGSEWTRRWIENNRNNDTIGGPDSYVKCNDAVSAGGFTGTLAHDPNSAWFSESWLVGSDPGTTYKHDAQRLQDSMLVPNWARRPNGTDEDNTHAYDHAGGPYTPLSRGNHRPDWTLGGYWPTLGVLPKWDAVAAKYSDARGFAWAKVQALSVCTYPIVFRNAKHQPPLVSEIGVRDSPADSFGANGVVWDSAHGVNSGYVPYLLTGDFRFLETMRQHCAAHVYYLSTGSPNSVTRGLQPGRFKHLRTIGQTVAIAPEAMGDAEINAWTAEYRTLLAAQCEQLYRTATTPAPYYFPTDYVQARGVPVNNLGITPGMVGGVGGAHNGEGNRFGGGFIPGYLIIIAGHLLDIECVSADDRASNLLPLLHFASKYVVERLGPGGPGSYPWDDILGDPLNTGGYLRLTAQDDGVQTFAFGYRNWGEVYAANFPAPRIAGTALKAFGTGGPTDARAIAESTVYMSDGSWVLPAISYALDYNAPGAAEAWARLSSADNFAFIGGDNVENRNPDYSENVGFGATPDFGILPRFKNTSPAPGATMNPALQALSTTGWADTGVRLIDPATTAYSGSIINTVGVIIAGKMERGVWLVHRGGGHMDSSNRSLYAIGPFAGESTLPFGCYVVWQQPYPLSGVDFDVKDDSPVSSHDYAAKAFLPEPNWMVLCGIGSRFPDSQGSSVNFVYDFTVDPAKGNPWSRPMLSSGSATDALAVYDDVGKVAWYWRNTGFLEKFVPATPAAASQWVRFDHPARAGLGSCSGAMHAQTWVVQDQNGAMWKMDVPSNAVQFAPSGPIPPFGNGHNSAAAWDDDAQRYTFHVDGDPNLYHLTSDLTTFTREDGNGITPPGLGGQGTYTRFGYIKGAGRYLLLTDGRLLFWRAAGGQVAIDPAATTEPAPTPPAPTAEPTPKPAPSPAGADSAEGTLVWSDGGAITYHGHAYSMVQGHAMRDGAPFSTWTGACLLLWAGRLHMWSPSGGWWAGDVASLQTWNDDPVGYAYAADPSKDPRLAAAPETPPAATPKTPPEVPATPPAPKPDPAPTTEPPVVNGPTLQEMRDALAAIARIEVSLARLSGKLDAVFK